MPIILANSNLLPFLSPRVGPTSKGVNAGRRLGQGLFCSKRNKELTIISNANQRDIARVAWPTHLQGVGKIKLK